MEQKCHIINIGSLTSFILLYANLMILLFSQRVVRVLRKALDISYDLSQHLKPTVNINKAKRMIFGSDRILPNF